MNNTHIIYIYTLLIKPPLIIGFTTDVYEVKNCIRTINFTKDLYTLIF